MFEGIYYKTYVMTLEGSRNFEKAPKVMELSGSFCI
jgi:hypothetical protein